MRHTVATRVEYAAHYPVSFGEADWNYYGPVTRIEAEQMVRYINGKARRGGFAERAELMQRTVVVGEWEPANTGIVPPHITERIEDE